MSNERPTLGEAEAASGLSPELELQLKRALTGDLDILLEFDRAVDHLNSAPLSEQFVNDVGAVRAYELRQAAVVDVWRMIASGTANIAEKDIWVSAVAKHIVDHVLTVPAELRARAALKSIGLKQVLGKNLELKSRLELEETLGPGAMLPSELFERVDTGGAIEGGANLTCAEEVKTKPTRAEKARISRIKKKASR